MKENRKNVESRDNVTARGSRSRTMTKALLVAGIIAAGVYVVGDVVSGLVYNSSSSYSFRDQWISELTAYGSPVRPLMVTVIVAHDLLLIALGLGIWRAAGRNRSLRWTGLILMGVTVLGIVIHPFFPMSSRWMESGFNDTMHGTLTFIWGPIIFGAVALSAVAYRGWFRLFSVAALVAMLGFGVASGIAIQGIEQNDTPWAGAFERVNAYVLMAWLVLLAMTVMRRSLDGVQPEQRLAERDQPREFALVGTR
jgi:predicted membrane channel-forming protein YqfA (hemolysin III family)